MALGVFSRPPLLPMETSCSSAVKCGAKTGLAGAGKGNYGIASFGTLFESVSAYMLNLNTHLAYEDLRNKRAELRKSNQKITGAILAEQLTKYSERGEDYVKDLKAMMEFNQLGPTDDAFLAENQSIFLIPVAD